MKKKILCRFTLPALSLFFLSGCMAKPATYTKDFHQFSGESEYVKILKNKTQKKIDLTTERGAKAEIDKEKMFFEVDLLVLRKYKWGKFGLKNRWVRTPLFLSSAKEMLVPFLISALQEELGPSEAVLFSISGRRNKLTQGTISLHGNKLVWAFSAVDGSTYLGKDKFWLDGEDWSIEERPGMVVKKNKGKQIMEVTRDLSFGSEQIVLDEQGNKESIPLTSANPVEKKLQSLKKWKADGLINEKEFDQEKRKVLNDFQKNK